MENHQRAHLEKKIKEKILSTKEAISHYQLLTKPVSPDNAIGRLTRMEAINSKSINEVALSKAEETLLQLEQALGQLDDPDFGMCRQCGEPIPPARLVLMPETKLYVPCAENVS
jgi:DnaK suppressor protein